MYSKRRRSVLLDLDRTSPFYKITSCGTHGRVQASMDASWTRPGVQHTLQCILYMGYSPESVNNAIEEWGKYFLYLIIKHLCLSDWEILVVYEIMGCSDRCTRLRDAVRQSVMKLRKKCHYHQQHWRQSAVHIVVYIAHFDTSAAITGWM